MNLRIINTILLLLGVCVSLSGQTKKAFLEAAEIAISDKDFHTATQYFKEALEFDTLDVFVMNKSADAARQFNAYTYATTNYEKVLELDDDGEYPMASFFLAEMYQKLGRYDEAITILQFKIGKRNRSM